MSRMVSTSDKPSRKRGPTGQLCDHCYKKILVDQDDLIDQMQIRTSAIKEITLIALIKQQEESLARAKAATGLNNEQIDKEIEVLLKKARVEKDLPIPPPAPTKALAQALAKAPTPCLALMPLRAPHRPSFHFPPARPRVNLPICYTID